MADWRDNLRTGSFRGVSFKIESHEFASGRRKVDHEFPQRDQSRSEDLGRSIRRFTLSLFVIGDDYFQGRDALLTALEKEGPGELIHPYLGKKTVQVGGFSLRETFNEGRVARFQVDFSEAGKSIFPDSQEDNKEKTKEKGDAARDASKNFFQNLFSVLNQPAHVIDGATADFRQKLNDLEGSVKKATAVPTQLAFSIKNMRAASEALVRAPARLADEFSQAFVTLGNELSQSPQLVTTILAALFGVEPPPVIGATPSRIQQQKNGDALSSFTRQQAVIQKAQSAVDVSYSSFNDAIRERSEITEELDKQLLDPLIDDVTYQALKDLQSAISNALPPLTIGEVVKIENDVTKPALVISYEQFKTVEKENEIISQNNIAHPGFVPGGTQIEVSTG